MPGGFIDKMGGEIYGILCRIAEVFVAFDPDTALHYIWPEMLAVGLFLIGYDIYQRRTACDRGEGKVVGLLFDRDKDFDVICEYLDAQGQRHLLRYQGIRWPELATGTTISLEISQTTPVGYSAAERFIAMGGAFFMIFALPYAWRDISAPDFSADAALTQLASTELFLCVVFAILRPFMRLMAWHDRTRLEENAENIVRYEDVPLESKGCLKAFNDLMDLRRRRICAAFLGALLAFFIAGQTWWVEATMPLKTATVVGIDTESRGYALWGETEKHVGVYSLRLKLDGAAPNDEPYALYTGMKRPALKAGDVVRLRTINRYPGDVIDEGPIEPALEPLALLAAGAVFFYGARRAWWAQTRSPISDVIFGVIFPWKRKRAAAAT